MRWNAFRWQPPSITAIRRATLKAWVLDCSASIIA